MCKYVRCTTPTRLGQQPCLQVQFRGDTVTCAWEAGAVHGCTVTGRPRKIGPLDIEDEWLKFESWTKLSWVSTFGYPDCRVPCPVSSPVSMSSIHCRSGHRPALRVPGTPWPCHCARWQLPAAGGQRPNDQSIPSSVDRPPRPSAHPAVTKPSCRRSIHRPLDRQESGGWTGAASAWCVPHIAVPTHQSPAR